MVVLLPAALGGEEGGAEAVEGEPHRVADIPAEEDLKRPGAAVGLDGDPDERRPVALALAAQALGHGVEGAALEGEPLEPLEALGEAREGAVRGEAEDHLPLPVPGVVLLVVLVGVAVETIR